VATDLMVSELRRAGYWSGVVDAVPDTPLPYGVSEVNAQCVLYSYEDKSATPLPYRGFRLNGQSIEWMRSSVATDNCVNGPWVAMTDKTVTVTSLAFSDNSSCINFSKNDSNCNPCTANYVPWGIDDYLSNLRVIDISIVAQSSANANASVVSARDTALVRNEEYGVASTVGPPANTQCGLMRPLLTV